jgi:hypothetical protein
MSVEIALGWRMSQGNFEIGGARTRLRTEDSRCGFRHFAVLMIIWKGFSNQVSEISSYEE